MAADQCFVSWSLGERLTGDGDDDWRTGKNNQTKCRIMMQECVKYYSRRYFIHNDLCKACGNTFIFNNCGIQRLW